MTSGQVKGALLEYIVRNLMMDCGFASVRPDGHYIFEQNGTGLFFINGKGAAHDADVLMEPPIQMPFSYPSRLLFECKSHQKTTGLDVIRNALGLRYDINEFEIVTDDSIRQRKNNHRASYAISDRKRYHYQIGVASVELFSSGAFEFAANNKIPLLSLRWFLPEYVCNLFHEINREYIETIPDDTKALLYAYLKDKSPEANQDFKYAPLFTFLASDSIIGVIRLEFERTRNNIVVGLLETGDLLFLFSSGSSPREFVSTLRYRDNNEARIHYQSSNPGRWTIVIRDFGNIKGDLSLDFNVPYSLLLQWNAFNFEKTMGYNLKQQFFSRIFIFFQRFTSYGLPFALINLDSEWIDNLQRGGEDFDLYE